jgi:membrane protein implicated in regulation of membrane protease activity
MQDYLWWWIIAGGLAIVEVASGTFYLLVLAVAALGASGLAYFGFGLSAQVLGAAGLAILGWLWLRRRAAQSSAGAPQDLDVGAAIEVLSWHNGIGITQYRGARWEVELAEASRSNPAPGRYTIQSLRGNRLLVSVLS